MHNKHINSTVFIGICLILLAICSFTVCLFLYFHGRDSALQNATIVFSYSDNSSKLMIDSSMPITDAIGKKLDYIPDQEKYGYSEFSVFANMQGMDSVQYEIYAKPVGVAVELPTNYVKLYLTDLDKDVPVDGYDGGVVPTYKDLKVANTDPGAKKVYSGTLKKNETQRFRLRIWLADTYPITTEISSFGVLLYVNIID